MTTSRTTTASSPVAAWTSRLRRAEGAERRDDDEPRRERRGSPDARAGRDRPAVDAVGVVEPGRDGREDEDALEALAEDEDRAVGDDGAMAEVRDVGRVGRAAAGGDDLPDEHAGESHGGRGEGGVPPRHRGGGGRRGAGRRRAGSRRAGAVLCGGQGVGHRGGRGFGRGPRRLLGHPNIVVRQSERECRPADRGAAGRARDGVGRRERPRACDERRPIRTPPVARSEPPIRTPPVARSEPRRTPRLREATADRRRRLLGASRPIEDAAGCAERAGRSGRRVRQVPPDVADVQPARDVARAVRDVEVDPGDEPGSGAGADARRAGRGRGARRRGPPCSGRGGGCGRARRRRSATSGRGRSPPRRATCRSRTGRRRARPGGRGARARRGCRPGGGTGCRRPTRTPSA